MGPVSDPLLDPDQDAVYHAEPVVGSDLKPISIIACGALAREILAIIHNNALPGITLTCLPASLHNHPDQIPERLRAKILELRESSSRILIGYADCGTGGLLDRVIAEESIDACPIERLEGPHCYAFFTGQAAFDALAELEPGTFYLTDYLARHFETLVVKGMGLDRYPEMVQMMFGNYTRLVYLAQLEEADLNANAEAAAERLSLRYERIQTGYGELETFIQSARGVSSHSL